MYKEVYNEVKDIILRKDFYTPTMESIKPEHLQVKSIPEGVFVKYFTGGSYGKWVDEFYPWWMVVKIIYD